MLVFGLSHYGPTECTTNVVAPVACVMGRIRFFTCAADCSRHALQTRVLRQEKPISAGNWGTGCTTEK